MSCIGSDKGITVENICYSVSELSHFRHDSVAGTVVGSGGRCSVSAVSTLEVLPQRPRAGKLLDRYASLRQPRCPS